MQTNPTGTYLISVRPTWADAFFSYRNPKTIELRKGNFGASLKAGDSIVIYATMPVAEIIGTVKVVKRESLAVDRLWQNQSKGTGKGIAPTVRDLLHQPGIGYWCLGGRCELFPSPIALSKIRQKFGQRWQPPQQIQQLNDDQIEMALNIAR
jgi:predicted transcriptional regulator